MTFRGALGALTLLLAGPLAADDAGDALLSEARRRGDALVKAGFNLTRAFSLGGPGEGILRMTLLVPPHEGEHVMSAWWETGDGEISLKVREPGDAVSSAFKGRSGEVTLSLALAPGAHVLELDRSNAKGGQALLGFKGALVAPCQAKDVTVEEIAADPSREFFWPYLLALPPQVKAGRVLVVPNNTGFSTEDVAFLRASASCEVARQAPLAARLGTPLVVPLFPRPAVGGEDDNLYLHALTRAALATSVPRFHRVDLQLLAMLDDARARLAARGIETDGRALLWGFSASGSFVSRFALLHPERVRAVAAGSPGGWPIAPAATDGGEALPYPVGVADLETLTTRKADLKAARGVSFLFFLGAEDRNDAVPFRDSFSKEDEALVKRRFGPSPVTRWGQAERLWRAAGLRARFALYPDVGHEVTREMDGDVARFFEAALAAGPR